jgi:hypothetical protein
MASREGTKDWSELYLDCLPEVWDVEAVLLADGVWHRCAEGLAVDRLSETFELVDPDAGYVIRGPMSAIQATRSVA